MEISESRQRLNAARERLDAKDLAAAIAIYDEVLTVAGDRPDVLLTISGDLGSHGHVAPIIELVAPRYDAQRHGPAIGFNVLQAYLSVRNTDAAQHILDMLFSLNRPELEERLYGFSNAIVETASQSAAMGTPGYLASEVGPGPEERPGESAGESGTGAKVSLASISKPIWSYGLESLAESILPPKAERVRRIAFGQLALTGLSDPAAALQRPEDELGRFARAFPLWMAETFYYSPLYAPIAAVGYMEKQDGSRQPMIFAAEWMTDNLRQLMDSAKGGLDYVITGLVRQQAGDYEIVLRVWEMKKFRERKQFTARWTPATADAELAKLHADVRQYMEWAPYPAGEGLPYAPPAAPMVWLDALGASLGLFMAEKKIYPTDLLPPVAPSLASLAQRTAGDVAASLAWLTLLARARTLGLETGPAEAALADDPLVAEARAALGLE